VTIRSQGFCRSMRPGSPMIRAASNASNTAGTTHMGFTRYCAGSATCRPAVTRIASATGHQCSPRSAAPSPDAAGVTGGLPSPGGPPAGRRSARSGRGPQPPGSASPGADAGPGQLAVRAARLVRPSGWVPDLRLQAPARRRYQTGATSRRLPRQPPPLAAAVTSQHCRRSVPVSLVLPRHSSPPVGESRLACAPERPPPGAGMQFKISLQADGPPGA